MVGKHSATKLQPQPLKNFFYLCVFHFFFEIEFHYVTQDGLELLIFLLLSPK